MNIILDTNIFRRDIKLKDRNFDIIIDYLTKTNSKIILPQIVFEEVKGLYERLLRERLNLFKNNLNKLKNTLMNSAFEQTDEISIDSEVKSYIDSVFIKLKLNEKSIIPYKNEYLSELVARAISRRKPLGEKGQQFRDGLLWLTIIDYTKTIAEKCIVLISDNPSDFSDKGQNKLHPELYEDANSQGVEVQFYKTIVDFIKDHAQKVDFLTPKWIKENINMETLESIFNGIIDKEEDYIRESSEDDLDYGEKSTGYIAETNYINSWLDEYYVYELSDGTLLLNLEVTFEKEYEMEIEKKKKKSHPDYEIGTDYKCIVPLFRAKFVATIIDMKIENYKFKEWDWG